MKNKFATREKIRVIGEFCQWVEKSDQLSRREKSKIILDKMRELSQLIEKYIILRNSLAVNELRGRGCRLRVSR